MSDIQEGAEEELTARGKTIQTDKDKDEMWVRWIKQKIHGELDSLRTALDLPEELEVFSSMQEGEEKSYSAEVQREAQKLQAALGDESWERVPAQQEYDEMLQEFWDEEYGAEGDDEAYEWDVDEWQIWDEEAQSSATDQRRKDDKPLLDPPQIDDEAGPIRDTDEKPGWIPGAFPSIFQNEAGDAYNFKLAKPDLAMWGPHVLRSRGWAAL